MQHWDPIGISDEPLAADEYDSYIPKIMALLRKGTTVEELMDYLDEVATHRMGFTPQREKGREPAERLTALRSQLDHSKT
jgi:hypothetical protein